MFPSLLELKDASEIIDNSLPSTLLFLSFVLVSFLKIVFEIIITSSEARSHCIAQIDLEFVNFLPQPS